jgi:hypothetical protein
MKMAEVIKISYKAIPPGQVGARPQKLAPGTKFKLTCEDEGDFSAEFIGESPVAGGAKTIRKDVEHATANKPGKHPFICILKKPNGQVVKLDPRDPAVGGGGEIEVVGVDG